jgi:hypothetical protein
MRRNLVRLAFCVLLPLWSACGDDGSPSSPSRTVQVGGVWSMNQTITSVSGGECFANIFQGLVGERGTGTAQIQQTGASLTATVTDDSSGGSCTYSGTAGSASAALNTTSCTSSDLLGATCPTGGVRNIRLQTGAINASNVTTSSMSGTAAETYNITTASGAGVGTLTINYSFTATRR